MHVLAHYFSRIVQHRYILAKFLIVGATATITNLGIVYLATEKVGFWYLFSSVLGFAAGITISFVFQKFWTFGERTREGISMQAALFLTIAIAGLAFNSLFVWTQVEFFETHYLLAQLISAFFIAVANFLLYRFLVFSRKGIENFEQLVENTCIPLVVWPALLALTVFVTRFPGFTLSYYQDEWKFARAAFEGISTESGLYHPPLTELLTFLNGLIFGADLLRVMPALFFVTSIILLFYVLLARVGVSAALLGSLLYSISAYGFVGSLMVDTDGAILPFFFLLSIFLYDVWNRSKERKRWVYALCLVSALVLGLLVKLSFIIVWGVIAVDWLIEHRRSLRMRNLSFVVGVAVGLAVFFVFVMALIHAIKPTFDVMNMIQHALSYAHIGSRNLAQVLYQVIKAIFFLSPLLVVPLVLVSKEEWRRYRPFFLYLFLGLVFYLVLFDFSRGALDKYLLFIVAPLSAIAGGVLARMLQGLTRNIFYPALLFGAGIVATLFILLTYPHDVMPLYPKSAWLEAALSGQWNILLPFMGGSGPPAFYMPLLFLLASWLVAIAVTVFALVKVRLQAFLAVLLVCIGIAYNGAFVAEHLYGSLHGSSSAVLQDALQHIQNQSSIPSVVTYNDYGAFELWRMGKYEARFYADPVNEASIRERFAEYGGSVFLVIDVPRLNPDQFYGSFIASCESLYVSQDKLVSATVYDCKNAAQQL